MTGVVPQQDQKKPRQDVGAFLVCTIPFHIMGWSDWNVKKFINFHCWYAGWSVLCILVWVNWMPNIQRIKKQPEGCFFNIKIILGLDSLGSHPFLCRRSTWFCISIYNQAKLPRIRKYRYRLIKQITTHPQVPLGNSDLGQQLNIG